MTGGEVGIMGSFHAVGPVDIAWVQYPMNSTNGLFLVNGEPRIINVENLKLLDEKTMQQSFQFQDLLNQFPKASVWPGDRDGQTWPNSQTGDKGGLAVCHRISAAERLLELRPCRIRHLYLELQPQRKAHGYQLCRHDTGADLATSTGRSATVRQLPSMIGTRSGVGRALPASGQVQASLCANLSPSSYVFVRPVPTPRWLGRRGFADIAYTCFLVLQPSFDSAENGWS